MSVLSFWLILFCAVHYAGESSFEVKTEADSSDYTEHKYDDKPYLVENGQPILELLRVFLADRTISRAFGTLCRLSVIVCDVLYCGKTVRPSSKVSEGVNRKPVSKSWFLGSPPYFYFRFRLYGHRDGRFCLIFAHTGQRLVLDGRN